MKVKDLIKELQKVDSELEVWKNNDDMGTVDPFELDSGDKVVEIAECFNGYVEDDAFHRKCYVGDEEDLSNEKEVFIIN